MITSEYGSILSCFIKEEILLSKKLSEVDPEDIRNQKRVTGIYLGGQALAHLISNPFQDDSFTNRFKSDCLRFRIELSIQMKKRLPLEENGIIPKLNVLDIKIVLDLSWSPESIAPLTVHFPHVISESNLNELDD